MGRQKHEGGAGRPVRRSLLGLAATLPAVLAGACLPGAGGAPAGGGQRPAGSQDKGPIRVFQWDGPTSAFGQWLLAYFESFPQKSGVQVEVLQSSGTAPLPAQQAAWLAAGDVPDVFPRTARGALGFAPLGLRNAIRPLTDFVKRDGFDLGDFWPKVLQLVTARDKLWVMPQDFNQTVLAYLVAPFREAAVPPLPTDWKSPAWTWEALFQRLQPVQARLAAQPLPEGAGSARWAFGRPPVGHFLAANGAAYLSEDGKRATVAEPPGVEALDALGKLIHTYRVAPRAQDPLPAGHPLANQSVAMTALAASGIINQMRAQAPDLEFDVTPFPRGPSRAGRPVSGGGGYVLAAASTHPDAAWELLKHIGDKEYAVNKVRNGGIGARISVAREHFVQDGRSPANARVYLDATEHAFWEPNLTNWEDVDRAVTAALEPLLRGEQPASEAAAGAKQAIEGLLPQGELFQ